MQLSSEQAEPFGVALKFEAATHHGVVACLAGVAVDRFELVDTVDFNHDLTVALVSPDEGGAELVV